MIEPDDFRADVDRMLDASKRVTSDRADWTIDPRSGKQRAIVPVEVAGVFVATRLVIVTYPGDSAGYSITLTQDGIAVARLDVCPPQKVHINPLDTLPLIVRGPHYHSWQLNRDLVENDSKASRLCKAAPYQGTLKFESALRWFAGEVRIIIPHTASIDLPTSTGLL